MSTDNRWEDAMRWAKNNGVIAKTMKLMCYRTPDRSISFYYGDHAQMHRDYTAMGVTRITDDML